VAAPVPPLATGRIPVTFEVKLSVKLVAKDEVDTVFCPGAITCVIGLV
jgi:hypothetical protein